MAGALTLKLTVVCSGVDAAGKAFEERTHTTAIQKNGGRLLTKHKLQPGARLQLHLHKRPDPVMQIELKEEVETGSHGAEWIFQFAAPADEFWGVRFPGEPVAKAAAEDHAASAALAKMSEQLALLAHHAEDHLHHCAQEIEGLRERFAREFKTAMDGATRQMQQAVRGHMETTFRSLLDDLAQRADEMVEKNLTKLRKAVEQTGVQHAKYLDDEVEAQLGKFQERLEKQTRQLATRLEELQAETESAMQETIDAALNHFEAGCTGLLRDLLHAAESHKSSRAAPARRK